MARRLECCLSLWGAALVLLRVALAQQSPFHIAIEYQRVGNLTTGQRALLESAVTAAYGTLRKYVRAKAPPSPLLCEPVCRSYRPLQPPPPVPPPPPSPPPPPPRPDVPPDIPMSPEGPGGGAAAQPSRRRGLLHSPSGATHRGLNDAATVRTNSGSGDSSSSRGGDCAGGSHDGRRSAALRRLTQVGAAAPPSPPASSPSASPSGADGGSSSATRRCYPDLSTAATDPRQQLCGRAGVRPDHVRDRGGAAAATSAAGGPGEATHLYLYVTADPSTADCAAVAANGRGMQAYTCLYDSTTGRPTMSSINVCPQALDLYDVDSLVARALRELIRALGVERVGFFGLAPPETYRSYVVQDTDPGGMLTRFLATPRVKQAVREFFDCDSAPGALLEDSYGANVALYDSSVIADPWEALDDPAYVDRAGLAFAGWETTHFQGDILIADPDPIPAAGSAPQVTALTLALLYDTTWYDVAGASEAGAWSWGRGSGCGLATRHCATLLANVSGDSDGGLDVGAGIPEFVGAHGEVLFCDPAKYDSTTLRCPPGGVSVGTCTARPLTTGASCGLLTAVTPRLATCTARELELAALSGGDAAAADTFGWSAGAASHCLPVSWPWIATTKLWDETAVSVTSDVAAAAAAATAAAAAAAAAAGLLSPSAAAAAAAAAVSSGAAVFPDPSTPFPVYGATCFRTSCSAAGELWFHVLGTAVRCSPGAVLNLTATDAGAASGGRLQRALVGPCPDAAAICGGGGGGTTSGGGGGGGGGRSCDATTCSSRGGECRPAAAAAGSGGGLRCYCRPGYGGSACEQYLGTATGGGGGGMVGAAEEDLIGLAAAFAVLETSVLLRTPLADLLQRQEHFLAAVSDSGGIPQRQLAVARVYGMSYLPAGGSIAALDGQSQAQSQAQSQVVFRALPASAAERDLFRGALEGAPDRLTDRLTAAGFPVAATDGAISYLGEAQLRTPGPPAPPPPPSPPSPRPPSLPSPLSASPSSGGGRSGLSGDAKVALGVGVSFGALLLLLIAALIGCTKKHAEAKRAADQDAAKLHNGPSAVHSAPDTPILNAPPSAAAAAATTSPSRPYGRATLGASSSFPSSNLRPPLGAAPPPPVPPSPPPLQSAEIQPLEPSASYATATATAAIRLELSESRAVIGDGAIRGGGGGSALGLGDVAGVDAVAAASAAEPPMIVPAVSVGTSARAAAAAVAAAAAAAATSASAAAAGVAGGGASGAGGGAP